MPRVLACALILVLSSLACRRAAPPEPHFRVETRKFERHVPGCGDASRRPEPCLTFHVQWPEVVEAATPDAAKKINTAIQARLQPADAPRGLDKEAAEFTADYARVHAQFPDASITYFIRRQAQVVYSGPTLVSIEIESSEFRGGPHPNSARAYLNLRPRSGAPVELAELLVGGTMPRLLTVAEHAFRRERGIDDGSALSVAGFSFPTDHFSLPENWGIAKAGLVFHYNPYEVAPYALGPTTILVAWRDLAGILRPDAGIAETR
jgi:hypothetical protein